MSKTRELLRRAQTYARGCVRVGPDNKRSLVHHGDEYVKDADDLKRRRSVVQAAFPKPDHKIG